jgi:murein L,D-transpeptidase YcbB/YkuD
MTLNSVPSWYYREIHLGDIGPDVDVIRRKFGLAPGSYDHTCEGMVRAMAKKKNVPSLGETVDAEAAEMIGESEAARAGLVPSWYEMEIRPEDVFDYFGDDVRLLRGRLALDVGSDVWTPEVVDAVRRFQSQHGLLPTGTVDETFAKALGEA